MKVVQVRRDGAHEQLGFDGGFVEFSCACVRASSGRVRGDAQ